MNSCVDTPIPAAKWELFIERLVKECDFQRVDGVMRGRCQNRARQVLKKMGYDDRIADRVLHFCHAHDGHCDCEIVFNVPLRILQSEFAASQVGPRLPTTN